MRRFAFFPVVILDGFCYNISNMIYNTIRDNISALCRAVRFPEGTHMLVSDYPEKFAEEISAVLRR